MKQYLLGIVTDFPASDDMYAADLNGDGSINTLDLAYFGRQVKCT
jgi:hypothetical protein